MTKITTITATAELATISEPSEGYGSADYTVELAIGCRSIEIECWGHCGWLAPGAHSDLDGCGLELWGDSQPGGWSVCDGDGGSEGRAVVQDGSHPEPHEPISIASGFDSTSITSDMVPEWADALAALAETPEDDDEQWEVASMAADEARAAVVAAIKAALGSVSCECDEPTAEEVWDELGDESAVDGVSCVRVGRWIGCPLVAWRDGDKYGFDWWPAKAPTAAIDAAVRASRRAVHEAVATLIRPDE